MYSSEQAGFGVRVRVISTVHSKSTSNAFSTAVSKQDLWVRVSVVSTVHSKSISNAFSTIVSKQDFGFEFQLFPPFTRNIFTNGFVEFNFSDM